MNIEHVALNVVDPIRMADWYMSHLGMRVLRCVSEPPYTRFLADESGRVVVELYGHRKAPVPDYAALDPLVLHIAFATEDVAAERQRLLKVGASSAGDIARTPAGDEMVFLRDPWGVALQLVKRARPLLEGGQA
jgi:catechol 2,3-dioxygenase-like lactoylglutathione lyase family enzyme